MGPINVTVLTDIIYADRMQEGRKREWNSLPRWMREVLSQIPQRAHCVCGYNVSGQIFIRALQLRVFDSKGELAGVNAGGRESRCRPHAKGDWKVKGGGGGRS
jgi:hypothetical protein